MTLPLIFFLLVGAVSLAAAIGVLLSREPVHSALFLLVNFATLAVLYVTLEAQFLAAAQIIVYAGGIVILILFVIMLIGGTTTDRAAAHRTWSRYVGLLLGVVLLGGIGYSILQRVEPLTPDAPLALLGGVPYVVGMELFTNHVLAFELVAILLLAALLGALVLGRQPGEEKDAPRVAQGSTLPGQLTSPYPTTQHERPLNTGQRTSETAREKELQTS
jgi:NADH-quinone oxidoreductase subunit J